MFATSFGLNTKGFVILVLGVDLLAGVAQLVRAPVCGTGGRRFEAGHSPQLFPFNVGKRQCSDPHSLRLERVCSE